MDIYQQPQTTILPQEPRKKSNAGLIILGVVVILLIIAGVIYAQTRKAATPAVVNDSNNIQLNNSSSQPTNPQTQAPAANVVTSSPEITKLTLVNLETFPVQYQARVTFNLAETCSTATVGITGSSEKNTFMVFVQASKPADAVCGQVIVPTTQSVAIPTSGLAAGTYTVKAGKFSKTFTITTANEPTYTSGK